MAPWQKIVRWVHKDLSFPGDMGGHFCSPDGLGDYVTLTNGQ